MLHYETESQLYWVLARVMHYGHCDRLHASNYLQPLTWWFATGRAPTHYEMTFRKLKPSELVAIARRCASAEGRYDECIEGCKQYLEQVIARKG